MKKVIGALFVAAIFCQLSYAQPPQPTSGGANPPPRPTVQQRIARLNDTLSKALHVTLPQQKAIDDAYTHFFAEADKLMGNNPPPRPGAEDEKGKQLHGQLLALQKQRDETVAKALPAEAYKKYQEIEKSLRPGGTGGQHMPPPPKQ